MVTKIPITNNEYVHSPASFSSLPGYLIFGEKNGKPALNHLGEGFMTPDEAVTWYFEQGYSAIRLFTGGDITSISRLAQNLKEAGKTSEEMLGELEQILCSD